MDSKLLKRSLVVLLLVFLAGCRGEYVAKKYYDKIMPMIIAGTPPDVGFIDTVHAPEFIQNGWLIPIDSLIDKDDLNDFYPQLLRDFQRNNQTYALPRDFQTITLFINSELFDKNGLTPPTTWDEFINDAAKLTDPGNDVYGFGMTPGFSNFLPFLYQAGGSLYKDSTHMNLRDSKEADQALEFYTSFYKNKWAFLNDGDWPYYGEYDTLLDRFKNGKVAMILGGNTMFFILKEMGAPVKVVELPAGPAGKATIAYTVGYGLMTQSSASGGPAVDLLKFATSKEAMLIWIGEDKLPQGPSAPPVYMPPRKSLRGNWMEAHPDAQAFLLGVDYAQPYQPAVTSAAKIAQFDQFASNIMNQVIQGNISVSEALNAIQTEGDAYLGGLK